MNAREQEIYNASETPGGYNKDGSYGIAFQEGALWADKHPSKELVKQILILCNHIKDEEKSDYSSLTDYPYGYIVDELVEKIKNKIENEKL